MYSSVVVVARNSRSQVLVTVIQVHESIDMRT